MMDPADSTAGECRAIPEQKSSPVWGAGATAAWTLLIGLVFLGAQFVTAIIYVAVVTFGLPRAEASAALEGIESNGILLSLCTFAALLVCAPLVLGIAKLKRGSNLLDYLGFVVPSAREFWRWSLITIAFCLLCDGIFLLLRQPVVPEFMLKAYGSASPRWVLWLAIIVAAPISEEICVRGFLFKGLAASRLRWYGAAIVSSLLWAAIHAQYDWYGVSAIFCLGLVFATARAMTSSTLLTIALHSMVNLLATVQTALTLR